MPITVTGLVEKPVEIPQELTKVRRIQRVEDFVCLEGWTRPNQAWAGYRLDDLIRLACPAADARFVEIASADFVTVLTIDDLKDKTVLLADTLNGDRLTKATGGPWRLVVSGGACHQSVKGVDRITVVDHDHGETARTIALQRLGHSEFGPEAH
jgi:DMSO/TMAO reductase YedYZ molybdopterin-dependent catalytic subunit